MKDDFDDLLDRWLRDRGASDRATIRALAGNVATLPPRRRHRPPILAAAAAVAVAVGLAAFALLPRGGSVSASPSVPVPPDPAAFAGDPRLAQCGASVATAAYVFEMAQARDYWLYLPAMGLSPELDVDAPGFVVVYRSIHPFVVSGGPAADGLPRAVRTTVAPGRHDICVLVGADVSTAERNIYSDVDTSGLTVDVTSLVPSDGPRPTRPPGPTPPPTPTPEPDPAWAADATTSLECDLSVSSVGPTGPMPVDDGIETPDAALHDVLEFFRISGIIFPTEGLVSRAATSRAELYTYIVAGRVKAAIVAHIRDDDATKWGVSSVASCDPAEWDPATPTGDVTFWSDAAGHRVLAGTIFSFPGPGHCGFESTIWLHVRDVLYFRDPQHVMAEWVAKPFSTRVTLPKAAVDSGFHSDFGHLWLEPDGDAYLVKGSGVERWPRSTDQGLGCA